MSRDARRLQLIEATIETIAARGISRTTLNEVARRAGLSHGLVLFHFASKENLLGETLTFMADEYHRSWTEAIAGKEDDPVAQLKALIDADFTPNICTKERLAAWCAFWGEAQSLPMYQEICGDKDKTYILVLEGIARQLLRAAGRSDDPKIMARILRLTHEGTWLDMTTMDTPYGVEEARETVLQCARTLFAGQFSY
jgi:AcrR family transcriptional regulator